MASAVNSSEITGELLNDELTSTEIVSQTDEGFGVESANTGTISTTDEVITTESTNTNMLSTNEEGTVTEPTNMNTVSIPVTDDGITVESTNTDVVSDDTSCTEQNNACASQIYSEVSLEPSAPPLEEEILQVDGSKVLEELECPVCLEYMTPPIFLCTSGHSICHKCKKQLTVCPTCRRQIMTTRNVALEKICREIGGLEISETPHDEEENLPKLNCVLDTCSWKGTATKIRDHIRELHGDLLLDDGFQRNSVKRFWDLPLKVSDKKIIFAFDEIFVYRQKLNTIKKVFLVAVKCFAPTGFASRFKYEVQLMAQLERFVNGRVVLDESADIEAAIFTETDCISVDYSIVKSFTSKKDFNYFIRLSRV